MKVMMSLTQKNSLTSFMSTCIIKREKDKVKKLESAHVSFESSHNDLLAK
jgi:hypothetical protein